MTTADRTIPTFAVCSLLLFFWVSPDADCWLICVVCYGHLLSADYCWQNDACPGLLPCCIRLLVCTISFCSCWLLLARLIPAWWRLFQSCFHGFYLILFVICCLIPALPFFWMLTNHGRRFLPSWYLLPTVRFLAFCLMLSVTDCLKLLIFDLNWDITNLSHSPVGFDLSWC